MANRSTPSGAAPARWRVRATILLVLTLLLGACASNDRNEAAVVPTEVPAPAATPPPQVSEPLPTAVFEETTTPEQMPAATLEASPEATSEATRETTVAGEAGEVTVAEITQNPDTYTGETVTVSGVVAAPLTASAFLLHGPLEADATDDELVVLNVTDASPVAPPADASVVVEGTVRRLERSALEAELGVELDEDIFAAYEGRMAIVANTVVEDQAANTTATPDGDVTVAAADDVDPTTDRNVTVAEIAGNLQAFSGQQVTVFEEVEEIIGERSFTLDEDAVLEGGIDSDLLVIIGADDDTPVGAGDLLRVTGTVRTFDLAEIEQEAGFDLDDNLYSDWTGRPAIEAETIEVVRDWPAVSNPPTDPALTGDFGRRITVAEIAGEPARFISQTVTVREEVEEVIMPGVFSLDEDALLAGGLDSDLLVITMPESAAQAATAEATIEPEATAAGMLMVGEPHEGELVEVTGTVRNLVIADVERELGLDLDDELVVEFTDRPVIIASQVTLVSAEAGAGEAPVTADDGETPAAMDNVPVTDIIGNLAHFTGRQVAVIGEVEEMVGNTAFSIDDDAALDGGIDDELLVVRAQEAAPFTADQLADMTAEVRGTVRAFDLAAFEQELGYDLDDTLFGEWAGRPAIIASAVDLRE